MKARSFFFFMWALFASTVYAQSDYSSYLVQAWEQINSGNCDAAQRSYNVFKELSGNRNSSIETAIANCKQNVQKQSQKAYNIGDDAGVISSIYKGYKIAYLDKTGIHGFAIRYYHTSEYPGGTEITIAELKLLEPNKYILGLSGEYWSTTIVEGTETAFTVAKHYTYNFDTQSVNMRRFGNIKHQYKSLWVNRF